MKGMRIKNHKNSFTTQNYRKETNVRFTPIGAIRLLPPLPVEPTANLTMVPRPADPAKATKTKVRAKTKAGHGARVAPKRTPKRK